MSDKQRQEDEIEVLESIYDQDLWIQSRWPSSGCLYISPDPVTEDFNMNIVSVLNGQSIEKNIKLQYLAPIELYFKCPEDYPSTSQPLFMVKCIWLSENSLSKICRKFDEIWDHTHSEILYDWAYFLKDCCSFLNIDRLNFTTEIFDESKTDPAPVCGFLEQTTSLKLKELKNKSLEDRDRQNESYSEERLRRRKFHSARRQKLKDNFKYETPKDIEISVARIIPNFSKENTSNDISYSSMESSSRREYFFTMLPRYGVRRKTVNTDYDSRVIPNYEEIRPNQLGICGSSSIIHQLIDYNDESVTRAFRYDSHFCEICLEEKQGSVSVRLQLCGHIYCRDCISEYLRVNINDGNLRALLCPHGGCGTSFTATQIRQCVDEAMYEKFEKLKLKITVEDDPNLLYCPRDLCQSVARRCPELGPELCHCSRCSFYFCAYCKKSFHGVQPCDLQNEERSKVVQEYLSADSVRRSELEKRYTKQMISKWVDEHLSNEWIQNSSRPCPNCNVPIQKNDGCNKMICLKCNIPFCWICNKCLSSERPYTHFSDPASKCYEKLFTLLPGEEEDFHFDEDEADELFEDLLFAAI